jgi:hypothetical protein
MSTAVYTINKGVNRSIEFKGLKAQYIWWLGGGIAGLLILFAVLYIAGVNPFVGMGLIGAAGTALFVQVYRMSRKYGQYGLLKKRAALQLPKLIRSGTRKVFMNGRAC